MIRSHQPGSRLHWPGLLLSASALALVSCANVSHMLLYQDTNLGIKGGYNPETSNVSLHIGFRRNFVTLVPKVNHDMSGDPAKADLESASVFSASSMTLRGLAVPDIDEMVVTGDAAVALGGTKGALLPFQKKSADAGGSNTPKSGQ